MWQFLFRKRAIGDDENFDPARHIAPGDSWLAFNDLAFASSSSLPDTPQGFAARSLSVLNHVLTTMVLSDRLVFVDTGMRSRFGAVRENICRYGRYLTVSEGNTFVRNAWLPSVADYRPIIGNELTDAYVSDAIRALLPPGQTDDDLPRSAGPLLLSDLLLALRSGATYSPNPLHSRALADLLLRNSAGFGQAMAARTMLRETDDQREQSIKVVNEFAGAALFDLAIPALFGVILRESNCFEDLFCIAMQLNNEAKGFRRWCRDLNEVRDPLQMVQQIQDAQEALRQMSSVLNSGREARLQISLIPGLASLQTSFRTSRRVEKKLRELEVPIRERSTVAFLSHLLSGARQVQNLEVELSRVFSWSKDRAHVIAAQYRSESLGQ
jgi:hypothetical protein